MWGRRWLGHSVGLDGMVALGRARLGPLPDPDKPEPSGITEYLRNGGSLETAQGIAARESSRTTKLYHRSQGGITLDEIERIPAV